MSESTLPKSHKKRFRAENEIPRQPVTKVSMGSRPSFADTLKNPNPEAIYRRKMDMPNLNDNNCNIMDEENGYDVQMEVNTHEKLCKPWNEGLVVKLIGGKHSFGYLKARLQQKWAPKGPWQLMDLKSDYYLARFQSSDDRLFVLTGGP